MFQCTVLVHCVVWIVLIICYCVYYFVGDRHQHRDVN